MNILVIMIPISLFLGFGFLFWFLWSVEVDQWTDLDEAAKLVFEEREQLNDKQH